MPTIPTGRMEQELRKLYLRFIYGLSYDSSDLQAKIAAFERRALRIIEVMGGQTASVGALAGFPVPKALDLSPYAGKIYNDMTQAAIKASIATGLNSVDAARQIFRAGMDMSFRSVKRLARTETTNAYWKYAFASVAELPALVMLWGSEDGPRTCAWCKERDGLLMDSSNLRDHPNGRCTPIPTLRSLVEYKGSISADGQIYWDEGWRTPTDFQGGRAPVIAA